MTRFNFRSQQQLSVTLYVLSDVSGSRDGATPPQDTSPRESPPTGWAALGLTYKVQWPLHILFTPAVLEKCVLCSLSLDDSFYPLVLSTPGHCPLLLCVQVQCCVQVPAECAAGAVSAAALLGSTDAEKTPQVQPDRCC